MVAITAAPSPGRAKMNIWQNSVVLTVISLLCSRGNLAVTKFELLSRKLLYGKYLQFNYSGNS